MPTGVYKRKPTSRCRALSQPERIKLWAKAIPLGQRLGSFCALRYCGNPQHMVLQIAKYGKAVYNSRTYSSWIHMIQRCENPKTVRYKYYGARGIQVCDRWHKFSNFLDDMGERPEGMTIDRFPDKNGNYEPGNCRWATILEQARNRRKWGTCHPSGTRRRISKKAR